MKRKTWAFTLAGVAVALLALAWAFAPRPTPVETAQVTQGRFEASIEEEAKTRVRDRYVVSAPLAGELQRIALREGDAVRPGDALALLTPVLPVLQDERTLREQQARVEMAQAALERAGARIARAQVGLQQARNELERSEALARQGFISPAKLDGDRLALRAAQQDLETAQQDRHVAGHEVEQARAALTAVQRGPAAGGGRTFVLRAPVAGRVLRVAQPSEATVAAGTPLLELGDTARLEVVAELLTTDALKAAPGSRVLIERWGGAGMLEGRVRLVEPAAFTKVSALGVEEQRVRVLIDLTSDPAQWQALGDGYRVGVRVITQAVDGAVQVPVGAVFPVEDEGVMAVYRLDGRRARLQPVEIAARNGAQAWVRSGLKPGQEVVIYPSSAVKDGGKVQPRKVS
ncbi:efflux RND transporter periplasmic adaptor subunit [Azohydromonas caseinilytica]|uniref:Efflux RND transporter periplasmic adaptor subunit n=1 Tax=Azohydromonas caseinilytica TaxID=2728836 RepID=A0A848FE09_9BURK|nr:efflux RND transporter periplasmic adaptor subunit [Azohydromonas caseinilytica]NML16609.1 efflux RND transporter periplasmic adaptor subunit [Azohydromonas caseinilytica]